MQGPWKAAEAWHCERPGKAIGEGIASITIDGQVLKDFYKEVDVWHHEQSLWEAIDEA